MCSMDTKINTKRVAYPRDSRKRYVSGCDQLVDMNEKIYIKFKQFLDKNIEYSGFSEFCHVFFICDSWTKELQDTKGIFLQIFYIEGKYSVEKEDYQNQGPKPIEPDNVVQFLKENSGEKSVEEILSIIECVVNMFINQ